MAHLTPDETAKVFAGAAVLAKLSEQRAADVLAQWRPQATHAPAALAAAPAAPPRAPQAQAAPEPPPTPQPRLVAPPGRIGWLVDYLRDSALYPSTEVAVCSALGLLAGIAGRAYATPGRPTGLNIYLVLVGRTGSGKEALHTGPLQLAQRLRQYAPPVTDMVNAYSYSSGPALLKAAGEGVRCSVTFASEFGRLLLRMANERDLPAQALRTVLTELYSKSGPHDVVGDLRYSDAAKRVTINGAVALSVVGETTPDTLYSAVTASMAADGFLSRVQCVPMPDQRGDYSYEAEAGVAVPAELLKCLQELATHAVTLLGRNLYMQVTADPEAADWLDGYRHTCGVHMEGAPTELLRSLHNRAHLKALKYASLMAVLENPVQPVVTVPMVLWACGFADRGVSYLTARAAEGDLGSGDKARQQYVTKLIRRWLTDALLDTAGLARVGIVTRKYLQQRTSDVAAFNRHPTQGATLLLDHTLRAMCDAGYLVECDKAKIGEQYGYQGRCYRVMDLPND